MFGIIAVVIDPPYCGTPRLSHQFPVEVVVAAVTVDCIAVLVVVTTVEIGVVLVVMILEVVDICVDVVVDELQDASNIAATIKKIKTNQTDLFFNFILHFN